MMSKLGFVTAHIFCNYLMLQIYMYILDEKRMIRFLSQEESLHMLTFLVLVCNIVGMCLMMKRHRNWFVVILHTLMPYGICTALSYAQDQKVAIIGGLAIAIGLSAVYAVLIFRQKIKRKTRYKSIIMRRIGKVLSGLYYCIGTTLAVFAILCFTRVFNPRINISSSLPATRQMGYTNETLQEAESDIMKLAESSWSTLTVQEKLDVLQVVANLEQAYLGIPQTLTVVAEDMEENLCGYYGDYEWTIYINRLYLEEKSAEFVLNTLCHEAYHAYQKRQVEVYCRVDENTRNMLMFREMETYFWEFLLYIDGEEDFKGYYSQKIEEDAREYAKKRVKVYEGLVKKLQEEGEG